MGLHPCEFDAKCFDVPASACWMAEQEGSVIGVFPEGQTSFNRNPGDGAIVLAFVSASVEGRG